MRRTLLVLVATVAAATVAPAASAGTQGCSAGWSMYGRDETRTFNQARRCAQMARGEAAGLVPSWFVPAKDSVTASPAVVDGTVYVGAWDGTFFAIDALSGRVRWTYVVDDKHRVAFGRIVSSAAVVPFDDARGRKRLVALFGAGATLYALDARTGKRLAQLDVDPRTPALRAAQVNDAPQVEIESSPAVAAVRIGHRSEQRIYVGMDVHNERGIGRTGVVASTLTQRAQGTWSLAPVWKFDAETGKAYAGSTGLTVGSGRGFGCGGVWSSPAVDARRGRVYFGTASCSYPEEARAAGENWIESVFAINAGTGALVWKRTPARETEAAHLDEDFGASANLFRLPGGRELVGEGRKDGRYYAFDRATGAPIWSALVAQPGYAYGDFAVGGFIGSPGVELDRAGNARRVIGATAIPIPLTAGMADPVGQVDRATWAVRALDASTGRVLWTYRLAGPSYGATSIADGVAYVSDTTNDAVVALDTATGRLLALLPLLGAPSSGPAVAGRSLYVGAGTRETDAEFKAVGGGLQDAFAGTLGAHPLSRVSGIHGFTVRDGGPGRNVTHPSGS